MAEKVTPDGRFRALAGQIAGLDLESLVNPAQGGTYNFALNQTFFEFILSFYADIAATDLNHIPEPVLETMYNHASQVLSALNSIKKFDFRQDNPNRISNDNIQNLQNQWREAYMYAAPHIAFAKVSSSAIAQELQTIKATANEIRAAWGKASGDYQTHKNSTDKELKDRLVEFEKVIAAAREASGKEAVSRQASEFEEEASKCLIASRLWFAATVTMVAASLIVVYSMFLKDVHGPQPITQTTHAAGTNSAATNQVPLAVIAATTSNEAAPINHAVTIEVLQQTIARILIVTLLYSMVVWVARNYFANRHNYTVNRHRRNAMQTFRAFVEGTKDPATQDFILRQAAACAFAPQQTGYLKDESLPTPAPNSQFIEITKPGSS